MHMGMLNHLGYEKICMVQNNNTAFLRRRKFIASIYEDIQNSQMINFCYSYCISCQIGSYATSTIMNFK